MIRRTRASVLLATALGLVPAGAGCGFAVKHPAVTTGVVGGTLGFATCKLASDDYPACLAVGGGVGAFLGLATAAALWLGGDGHSVLVEEQARPLPDDGRPIKRRRPPPADPDAAPATSPVPLVPVPANQGTEPTAPPPPAAPSTSPVSVR